MKAGKLPLEFLAALLERVEVKDPRVALGPRPGADAALIDMGDRYLVAKTDPVTFASDLLGWYVVHVNANDVAGMGATPKCLMVTLLLPEGTDRAAVENLFGQIRAACAALNVTLVGGHTEVTYDLPRAIAVGVMLGEVDKDRVVRPGGARPGDSVVLTKGIAIEGTALLAREAAGRLAAAGVAPATIERAKGFLYSPGISVIADAATACRAVEVHSMHDPTEGGLATGLWEVAQASGKGLVVDMESITFLPECLELCRALGLDPLGLLASGALLICLPPHQVPRLIDALAGEGIAAREIGHITRPEEGISLRSRQGVQPLPTFERDELARYFEKSERS